jgi:hypothetical protein
MRLRREDDGMRLRREDDGMRLRRNDDAMRLRRNRGAIVFMVIWLTFWTASILIVLWMVGRQALSGEVGAAPFLFIWLGFAGLGLYAGGRRLQTLTGLARPPEAATTPSRGHVWRDGINERRDG